jgi:hypothetical protein
MAAGLGERWEAVSEADAENPCRAGVEVRNQKSCPWNPHLLSEWELKRNLKPGSGPMLRPD